DIAPIGILLTDIQAMDTHLTHSRGMDIQAIRVVPVPSVPRAMGTKAMLGTLITQVRRAMNTTATRGTPLIPVPRATDHLATWDTRLTLARRATKIRAIRLILPRLVPVLNIPCMAIQAITPQRVGRLGPSIRSNLLAEVRHAGDTSSCPAIF